MNCKNCNNNIPDGSSSCPICGTPVSKGGLFISDSMSSDFSNQQEPQIGNTYQQSSTSIGGESLNFTGEYCPYCGSQNTVGSVFCQNCGQSLSYTEPQPIPPPPPVPQPPSSKGIGKAILIASSIAAFLAIAAVVVCLVIIPRIEDADTDLDSPRQTEQAEKADKKHSKSAAKAKEDEDETDEEDEETEKPTSKPTQEPERAPLRTPLPENSSSNGSTDPYTRYSNGSNFVCCYPSSFLVGTPDLAWVDRYAYAPDGSGYINIGSINNSNGRSATTVADNFIATYPGTRDYYKTGSDYCAVRTKDSTRYHYCYFKLINGKIHGFEMHFDTARFSEYDKYINDIYGSMKY